MDLRLPADEIVAGDPGRTGRPFPELDLEVHPDRVGAAACEAVVIGERVATSVATDDLAAGSHAGPRGITRGHHGGSSSQ